MNENANAMETHEPSRWLFWTCFFALVATSFGFIIRNQVIGEWQIAFNLSETQKGELFGVGLWPFTISIVLFSLIIDKIGYGRAMWFALVCHVASTIVTLLAKSYWGLYVGTFILAIGNGTVEAVINPAVATVYKKEKTKWLNVLHAGWPGGMVLGGLLILILIPELKWQYKVSLLFIPVVIYGFMMLSAKFPVHERVQAGISFRAMLQEAGIIGAAIVVLIIMAEIARVFSLSLTVQLIISAVLIVGYGIYVRSVGQPLFIFLLLIIMPLAITELGTDSWITDLMKSIMQGSNAAGFVIVYTAFIMMVLRFSAGPIVERLKPLGLLAVCCLIAIVGLVFLSRTAGILIFVAATIFAVGKSFFWPTMLGVVAERFPKGGALTLNTISGVGMLTVGVIGTAFFGNIVDKPVEQQLENYPEIHQIVIGEEKTSIFGSYRPIDNIRFESDLTKEQKNIVSTIKMSVQKNALQTIAFFPAFMFICYVILLFYFKSKGGYKTVQLE